MEKERVWQGGTVSEFCEEIGHSRASHYRWKDKAEEGQLGRPKVEGEIAQVMEWEIRAYDRQKEGRWGTRPMYETLGGLIPRSLIDKVLDERRKAEGRVSRPHAKRYEFVAPRVAYSADFIAVHPGRILRLQDERSRLTLGFAHQEKWPEDDVAKFTREVLQKMGLPLFFKHDLGGEFRSAVFQSMLRDLLVVAVPSPPYYPRFNGKNERGNLEARRWIASADEAREPMDVVLEKLRKGTYDQNELRMRKVLGSRTSREVFDREPLAAVDRAAVYSDWDAQREEILRRHAPDGVRREAAELEAKRLAALIVVKKYNLVRYEKPEDPKVSG